MQHISRLRSNKVFYVLAACCLVAFVAVQAHAQTWNTVWSQTFNGAAGSFPSTNDWNYNNGNPGVNGEWENYCPPWSNTAPCSTSNPNIYEDGNGNLVIRAINNGGTWTSGRMDTSGHHDIQYGRFEATMILPNGPGLWPAWWMLGSNIGSVGWPTCGEIDIMENIPAMGQYTIQSSTHGGNGWNTGNQTGLSSGDWNWHTYGVNWWPGNVDFYVDNYQTPFVSITPSSTGGTWEFNNGPFFMLLNLAVGGNWPGAPNSSTPNPAYMLVNKINVLQYGSSGATEGPYGGNAATIAGTVMAENYDTGGQGIGYNVTSTNGTDNAYRSDGVDLETASSPATGNDLGWTAAGQWFRYTVNVATAGTYTVNFLVSDGSGAAVADAFHLSNSSGTNLSGSVSVPNTGGWQNWTTVTATVTLPAGVQTLTLNQDAGGWNVDSMAFALNSSSGGGVNLSGIHVLHASYSTGYVVDDLAASTASGNPVDLYTANGTAAQNWNFSNSGVVPVGDYNLAVLGANCMDVAGSGTANGTKVDIAPCNGQPNQSWNAVPSGSGYTLQPANAPGQCLDSPDWTTTTRTQLQIWQCNGGTNQTWLVQ